MTYISDNRTRRMKVIRTERRSIDRTFGMELEGFKDTVFTKGMCTGRGSGGVRKRHSVACSVC